MTKAEIEAIAIDYELNFPKRVEYKKHEIMIMQEDDNKFIADIYDLDTFNPLEIDNEPTFDKPEEALNYAKKLLDDIIY